MDPGALNFTGRILNSSYFRLLDFLGENLQNESQFQSSDSWNENSSDSEQSLVLPNPYADVTAAIVLIVGVFGNSVLLVAFLCRPLGRRPQVLDRIVAVLALIGLLTSLTTTPVHLYAAVAGHYPVRGYLCQMQGFLLNLLCLMGLWSSFILTAERFFIVLSPHEHALTFSLLNLNVIFAGVLVLLLVEVSGPIYGWAQYSYLQECAICFLDPDARHIQTYALIHTLAYVGIPAVTSLWFVAKVVIHAFKGSARVVLMSQMIQTPQGIVWLCGSAVLSMALLLPYHTLLMLYASDWHYSAAGRISVYWLHIVAITCVYPITLMISARDEIFQQLSSTCRYAYLYCFDKEMLDEEIDLEMQRQTRLRLHVGTRPAQRKTALRFGGSRRKAELTSVTVSSLPPKDVRTSTSKSAMTAASAEKTAEVVETNGAKVCVNSVDLNNV